MTSRERVIAAARFEPVDRPPYDLFDEAGDLFSAGRYDPALRLRLTHGEQVEARLRFHRKYRTDLIFDVPVIVPSQRRPRGGLTFDGREVGSPGPVPSSVSGMGWNAMPPKLIGPGLLPADAHGMVVKHLEWPGGRRSREAIDLTTGTTDVAEPLFAGLRELLGGLDCLREDLAGADWSHVRALRASAGADVMLSGTVLDPFSALTWYVGLQPLLYALYDEPALVEKGCEALAQIAVRTASEMVRQGLDMVRIGAAACCLLPAPMYRRFALPWQKQLVRAVQSGGSLAHLHLCGNVKQLLEVLPESGAVILETITPPPLGDTTLREAKERVGRRMCLKGNLSPTGALRTGSVAQCLAEARECLAEGTSDAMPLPVRGEGHAHPLRTVCGHGTQSGFMFSVADNLAPGTPEENLAAITEMLHG